jgi:hypothetical protein
VAQARQLSRREDGLHVGGHLAQAHAHQVFLVHAGVLADQLARHAAVLRQHQQAHRVDVQPPGGRQAAQLGGREALA